VILEDAEPFLRHIGWTDKREADIVAAIAADFGMKPENVADDFREFVTPLMADGFLTTENTRHSDGFSCGGVESAEDVESDSAGEPPAPRQNFDADGNIRDDSWTPLGDFFRENGLPMELHIDLTAACTERCVHCYLPDYPNRHLPFTLVDKALREFRAMQGLTVHLTGGECMLHPEFEDVCRLCVELNLNFIILSNLTVCDDKRIAFLAEVQPQFVNVSLYSMDPAEHDSITQLPGSWRRTMDAILACEKAGVHVRITTPLLKENRKAFTALAAFAREHRMHLVPGIDIVPQSNHDCSNLEHACSAEELREALAENKDLFDRGWETNATMPSPDENVCDIGISRLYLNSFGNYYPCDSMHGHVLGNATTDTQESIWRGEKLEYLRRLANKDFPQCAECGNRPFCKVCPAFNFNATGDIFTTTPAKCAVAAVVREVYGGCT
jgi:radical SAM protein with 4Fe4S-binding SPASM domain